MTIGAKQNKSIRAKIIAKRSYYTRDKLLDDRDYYITFETVEKRRMEFSVNSATYGNLIKGDVGTLFYRDNWFWKNWFVSLS